MSTVNNNSKWMILKSDISGKPRRSRKNARKQDWQGVTRNDTIGKSIAGSATIAKQEGSNESDSSLSSQSPSLPLAAPICEIKVTQAVNRSLMGYNNKFAPRYVGVDAQTLIKRRNEYLLQQLIEKNENKDTKHENKHGKNGKNINGIKYRVQDNVNDMMNMDSTFGDYSKYDEQFEDEMVDMEDQYKSQRSTTLENRKEYNETLSNRPWWCRG